MKVSEIPEHFSFKIENGQHVEHPVELVKGTNETVLEMDKYKSSNNDEIEGDGKSIDGVKDMLKQVFQRQQSINGVSIKDRTLRLIIFALDYFRNDDEIFQNITDKFKESLASQAPKSKIKFSYFFSWFPNAAGVDTTSKGSYFINDDIPSMIGDFNHIFFKRYISKITDEKQNLLMKHLHTINAQRYMQHQQTQKYTFEIKYYGIHWFELWTQWRKKVRKHVSKSYSAQKRQYFTSSKSLKSNIFIQESRFFNEMETAVRNGSIYSANVEEHEYNIYGIGVEAFEENDEKAMIMKDQIPDVGEKWTSEVETDVASLLKKIKEGTDKNYIGDYTGPYNNFEITTNKDAAIQVKDNGTDERDLMQLTNKHMKYVIACRLISYIQTKYPLRKLFTPMQKEYVFQNTQQTYFEKLLSFRQIKKKYLNK